MNLLGSKKIETKRLILRKTEEEDLKKHKYIQPFHDLSDDHHQLVLN